MKRLEDFHSIFITDPEDPSTIWTCLEDRWENPHNLNPDSMYEFINSEACSFEPTKSQASFSFSVETRSSDIEASRNGETPTDPKWYALKIHLGLLCLWGYTENNIIITLDENEQLAVSSEIVEEPRDFAACTPTKWVETWGLDFMPTESGFKQGFAAQVNDFDGLLKETVPQRGDYATGAIFADALIGFVLGSNSLCNCRFNEGSDNLEQH